MGVTIEKIIQDDTLRQKIDIKKYVGGKIGLPT